MSHVVCITFESAHCYIFEASLCGLALAFITHVQKKLMKMLDLWASPAGYDNIDVKIGFLRICYKTQTPCVRIEASSVDLDPTAPTKFARKAS